MQRVIKRLQATDEGVIESAMDGARDASGSKRWIRQQSKERWIREKAMDQGAFEGAMFCKSDGSGSKRSISEQLKDRWIRDQ